MSSLDPVIYTEVRRVLAEVQALDFPELAHLDADISAVLAAIAAQDLSALANLDDSISNVLAAIAVTQSPLQRVPTSIVGPGNIDITYNSGPESVGPTLSNTWQTLIDVTGAGVLQLLSVGAMSVSKTMGFRVYIDEVLVYERAIQAGNPNRQAIVGAETSAGIVPGAVPFKSRFRLDLWSSEHGANGDTYYSYRLTA